MPIKEHDEKTILVANTFNATPIRERDRLEHFTPQVVAYLSRHPILLMTGWDLYRMVGEVLAGTRSAGSVVGQLYGAEGRLRYHAS